MNKLIFVVGMRRSGTSILQRLIGKHDEVAGFVYEPHHFQFAMRVHTMARYHDDAYVRAAIDGIAMLQDLDAYTVVKMAFNPGIEAMIWQEIRRTFPGAAYVFATRDPRETHESWLRDETSSRGVCEYQLYLPWWHHITDSFTADRCCHIRLEDLKTDTDTEMDKVWDLIGVDRITGLDRFVDR